MNFNRDFELNYAAINVMLEKRKRDKRYSKLTTQRELAAFLDKDEDFISRKLNDKNILVGNKMRTVIGKDMLNNFKDYINNSSSAPLAIDKDVIFTCLYIIAEEDIYNNRDVIEALYIAFAAYIENFKINFDIDTFEPLKPKKRLYKSLKKRCQEYFTRNLYLNLEIEDGREEDQKELHVHLNEKSKRKYYKCLFGYIAESKAISKKQLYTIWCMLFDKIIFEYDIESEISEEIKKYKKTEAIKYRESTIKHLADSLGCTKDFLLGIVDDPECSYSKFEKGYAGTGLNPISYAYTDKTQSDFYKFANKCICVAAEITEIFNNSTCYQREKLLDALVYQYKINMGLKEHLIDEFINPVCQKSKDTHKNVEDIYIRDGVIDKNAWSKAKVKVIYLLLDIDSMFMSLSKDDIFKFSNKKIEDILLQLPISKVLSEWQYGIAHEGNLSWDKVKEITGSENNVRDILSEICLVNCKKTVNGGDRCNKIFEEYFNDPKNIRALKSQLCNYDADFVVCCGTAWIINLINEWEWNKWGQTSRGVRYYKDKKTIYIDFCFPDSSLSKNILYYSLLDAIQEIKQLEQYY